MKYAIKNLSNKERKNKVNHHYFLDFTEFIWIYWEKWLKVKMWKERLCDKFALLVLSQQPSFPTLVLYIY